tara:strand:+ start:1356 stop:2354 length:999 start_codon:yes stop_codon:yes gene_type:complete
MSQMTDFFGKTSENNANNANDEKISLFADTIRSGKYFMLALMERLFIMTVSSIPSGTLSATKKNNKYINNFNFTNLQVYNFLYRHLFRPTKKDSSRIKLDDNELEEFKLKYGSNAVKIYNKYKGQTKKQAIENLYNEKKWHIDNQKSKQIKITTETIESNQPNETTNTTEDNKVEIPKSSKPSGYLYFATNEDCTNVKIGETCDLARRLKESRSGGKNKKDAYEKAWDSNLWKYNFAIKCKDRKKTENMVLDILGHLGFHKRGEVFNISALDSVVKTVRKSNRNGTIIYKGDKYERIQNLFETIEQNIGYKKSKIIEGEELDDLTEEKKEKI